MDATNPSDAQGPAGRSGTDGGRTADPSKQHQLIWTPQPGPQTAFVTSPVPDILFGGARGGGKSDGLLGAAITKSLRYKGLYRGLLVRRTYDELDELIERSVELLQPTGARWRGDRRTWEFAWGGWLRMRYLKRDADASRYQGHSYNDLLVDEAGNFADPAPIDKLNGTLRDKHGVPTRMAMTANPGGAGHDWIRRRYIDHQTPGAPFTDETTGALRVYIPSLLTDNRLLIDNDPTYVQRLRKVGPAWLVRAWLLGDWSAAPDGNIVKIDWFKRYLTPPTDLVGIVQSWDTGSKPKEVNDPSVCTTWALTREGAYLLHVFRERLTFPKLRDKVKHLFEEYKPMRIIIEDKASGQALIQELRDSTALPITAYQPIGDKLTRMQAETGTIEAGNVYLPAASGWLQSYESELTIFPGGRHDDQVDSTSQFLHWWRTTMLAQTFEFESTGRRAGAQTATQHEGALDYVRYGNDHLGMFNP